MSKIFIEFFSEEALENIMILLKYKPDKVIFIGHKHNMITRKINNTVNFTKRISPDTSLEFIEVSRDNINEIIETLDNVCDKYPDAIFELTGGGELILIAYGIVSMRRNLTSVRIDPFTSVEVVNNNIDNMVRYKDINMTVADNMILHGGVLTSKTGNYFWKLNDEDFRRDVRSIWKIAAFYGHKWNAYTSLLADMMKKFQPDKNGTYCFQKQKVGDASELLYKLRDIHVITHFDETTRHFRFRYKNEMIQQIIAKIGNILELHVYEVATRKRDSNIFTDAVIGAMIDWDGTKTNMNEYRKIFDTTNEIDVILMRDVVPTFISCKSGKADNLTLHELQTITTRFGGRYAKKILAMAMPCANSVSGTSYFKQRAKDMQIWVIDDIYSLSDSELYSKILLTQGP